jgi:succinyl-CoA synthetase beta subunit
MLIASAEGGMDIETVAKNNPDAILKEPINITDGPLNNLQACVR